MQNKCTPLHAAAETGQSGAIQLLFTAKGNPNAADAVSAPPSASIMELCSSELCGGLVQSKQLPLHIAVYGGHSESVKLLLTAKSNVNAANKVSTSLPCPQ